MPSAPLSKHGPDINTSEHEMRDTTRPRTIIEKLWDSHVVAEEPGAPALLYIDLHLVHEVTSPQAFDGLRRRGLRVRRPDLTFSTVDHSTPTTPRSRPFEDPVAETQVAALEANSREFGITCFDYFSEKQGIVHVIGPELGLTQPGMTVVCGDSHTATHGAFGALAFGIGTSEVEHVLASQCLLQRKSKICRVCVDGDLKAGVTAKDIILALIAKIGSGGATGHTIEFTGETIRSLSMEERMTICNMSIEAGARAGLIAPDDTTYEYLAGRPFTPQGAAWEAAISRWKSLPSDAGCVCDQEISLTAAEIEPMITFGTNPGMGMSISSMIPDPADVQGAAEKKSLVKALEYMGLLPGEPLLGRHVNMVFIGSCTNGRIEDLRAAASVLRGRKIHSRVRTLIVPGSRDVQRRAEAEGLDTIFRDAGAEWREAGCSMCIAMNGDRLLPGEYCVSTSNRNFEGRQGKGGRTFLASPLTAAASAVNGAITDIRTLL